MRISAFSFFRRGALLILFLIAGGLARSAAAQDYLLTNDDSFSNGVSYYTIGGSGALKMCIRDRRCST